MAFFAHAQRLKDGRTRNFHKLYRKKQAPAQSCAQPTKHPQNTLKIAEKRPKHQTCPFYAFFLVFLEYFPEVPRASGRGELFIGIFLWNSRYRNIKTCLFYAFFFWRFGAVFLRFQNFGPGGAVIHKNITHITFFSANYFCCLVTLTITLIIVKKIIFTCVFVSHCTKHHLQLQK